MTRNTLSITDRCDFQSVWEARLVAIAEEMSRAGHFGWTEWTQMLGSEIARNENNTDLEEHEVYFVAFVGALRKVLTAKGVVRSEELDRFEKAWTTAGARTPHGQPIELQAEDFHS